MWLKVDDSLIDHPKMLAAGRHLGRRGRARAFCVYMAGLMWVNRHLTDGFIPNEAVLTFTIDERPCDVAEVLSMADVRLFHRETTGFRIHDYHDFNPEAQKVKAKLAQDRERKRVEREKRACASTGIPRGLPSDSSALARARSRSISQPLVRKFTGAPRQSFQQPVENPTVLTALIWREALAAWGERLEAFTIPNVTERLKGVAARARLAYGDDRFHQQIEIAMARVAQHHGRRSA